VNLGKLKYMSPEQELNASEVDHRSDLYSLGVIFFEMLVGHVPMPGQRITDFRPDLPPEADLFLVRALARDPDERFSSAREFHDALLDPYQLSRPRQDAMPAAPMRVAAAMETTQSPGRPGLADRIRRFFRRLFRRTEG